ncbi:TPA: hypothetical protein ACMDP0_002671 [Vibrio parahaemolyticus]
MLYLNDGEPLLFGKEHSKAIASKGFSFTVVDSETPCLMTHCVQSEEAHYAYALANLSYPEFPVSVGVFRAVNRPTFDQVIRRQQQRATQKYGEGSLAELLKHNSHQRVC